MILEQADSDVAVTRLLLKVLEVDSFIKEDRAQTSSHIL
jgi:hypothetical protein